MHPAVKKYLQQMRSNGGKKAQANRTPEERSRIAKEAIHSYWDRLTPEERSTRNKILAAKRKPKKKSKGLIKAVKKILS